MTYVWLGDWTNQHGDVVTYAFTSTDVRAPSDVMVAATVVGIWHVRTKVLANRDPNLSISTECLRVLRERR